MEIILERDEVLGVDHNVGTFFDIKHGMRIEGSDRRIWSRIACRKYNSRRWMHRLGADGETIN
jgi:hypothetical protein